ncbi:MAG: PTS-dependent dihydroxyacetone kinase operon transcriptional regulator DhaR [Anaerolineales bacterium]|nr:PTS-dependent dihydroxyacetone kinase operon transcriptional regulator DhaR [Anaerolineales bacterium]
MQFQLILISMNILQLFDKIAVNRNMQGMQPSSYPIDLDRLSDIWQQFIDIGQLDAKQLQYIDPAILQSWRRCLPRLNARATPRLQLMRKQALSSLLKVQADLLVIGTPVIEDIHQFIEGSNCAILLADGTGHILTLVGDATAVDYLNALNLGQGTYWSEGQIGTNAFGTILVTAMPMQVVGAEHYFQIYHQLASSAAPVHDVSGRIIGVLGIVGPAHRASSHTLGLVMTAARAISNQFQANWSLAEANHRLTEVNSIMSAISEGVIAWNADGKINHANAQAGAILGFNPNVVAGHLLNQVISLPTVVTEAIEFTRELQDVEAAFQVNGRFIHTLISLHPLFEADANLTGFIALIRPIEQVRQLVQQQTGTHATLTIDDVYGQSASMRGVLRQARIAARGTAPVLLRGDGGVGKNHLAQAIHNDSKRADKPFLAINCRAIPHELMAGEILGHEEGSAGPGRPSKFELADGGTLLLDQVESLSLELQAALLQLIETRHVMRLAGMRPIAVDVRIIAATTANLEKLVTDGAFLDHLYYRFGVFNIKIPPLRHRIEDLPLLAERFLARITRRDQRAVWIDDEALTILQRYPWPGNVRELEGVLERALHQSEDGIIHVSGLPEVVRYGRVLTNTSPKPQLVLSFAEAEREAIMRAGWAYHGQVTEMARQLGIARNTLWRKMKQYGISPRQFKE